MQHRSGQQLESTPQHAAGCADTGFVLIEPGGDRVTRLADIDAVVIGPAVAVVEQHQVDVGAPAPPGLEARTDFVGEREPFDVAHREPGGNRSRGALPQALERGLDVHGERAAHPQFMDAVRACHAIARSDGLLQFASQRRAVREPQRPNAWQTGTFPWRVVRNCGPHAR